jgi:hypothetical protein
MFDGQHAKDRFLWFLFGNQETGTDRLLRLIGQQKRLLRLNRCSFHVKKKPGIVPVSFFI